MTEEYRRRLRLQHPHSVPARALLIGSPRLGPGCHHIGPGFLPLPRERHPKLHHLMSRFKEKAGCPVIINTSFNIRGEPIVCSPEHAYRCFMATNMDVLVMENQLLYKQEQPQAVQHEVDEYKAQFELD